MRKSCRNFKFVGETRANWNGPQRKPNVYQDSSKKQSKKRQICKNRGVYREKQIVQTRWGKQTNKTTQGNITKPKTENKRLPNFGDMFPLYLLSLPLLVFSPSRLSSDPPPLNSPGAVLRCRRRHCCWCCFPTVPFCFSNATLFPSPSTCFIFFNFSFPLCNSSFCVIVTFVPSVFSFSFSFGSLFLAPCPPNLEFHIPFFVHSSLFMCCP